MALHSFETAIALPGARYDNVVRTLGQNPGSLPREYQSLVPTFDLEGVHVRIGEIVFTHALDEEFAGVLFVGDGHKDQRGYDRLLRSGKLPSIDEVPICSFDAHLIAGKRIGSSDLDFHTTSVVRDTLASRNQIRATKRFRELTAGLHISEFEIKPQDVYDLAKLLQKRIRKPNLRPTEPPSEIQE